MRSPRTRARSFSSSTRCTWSSAPALPRVRWTPGTCSSRRWPAASCTSSGRRPWTSTARTSRGSGARAAVPASACARAYRRRDDRDPPRTQGPLRGVPSCADHRRGDRGRGELSDRYIRDRFLPDKAIDLIDQASARIRLRTKTKDTDTRSLEEDLRRLARERDQAKAGEDYDRAGERDRDDRNAAAGTRREGQGSPARGRGHRRRHRRGRVPRYGDPGHPAHRRKSGSGCKLEEQLHERASARTRRSKRSRRRFDAHVPGSETRIDRPEASSSSVPPGSARPSSHARWPRSCSAART